MARIRTIKPSFFTSLTVSELTTDARLTFIGLWTHCDDEGRCIDDARLVKAAVWPLERTVKAVEADLAHLAKAGLIVRYQGERPLIQVVGWSEHQRINRPTASAYPAPDSLQGHVPLTAASVNGHGGLTPGREGKGKEGNREGKGVLQDVTYKPKPADARGALGLGDGS